MNVITAAEIRAELARRRWHKYQFAARIEIHPSILGRMLAERVPITPAIAERMRRVFRETA
jgi:plasmid maintenance system antidote protein VapI